MLDALDWRINHPHEIVGLLDLAGGSGSPRNLSRLVTALRTGVRCPWCGMRKIGQAGRYPRCMMTWKVEITDPDETTGHFRLASPGPFPGFHEAQMWTMRFATENPEDQGSIVLYEVGGTERVTARLDHGRVLWDDERSPVTP